MGLLAAPERRAIDYDPDIWESLSLSQTNAGVTVTADTAMQSAAVFACVRILAESIAALSLILYERQADGGKRRAVGHNLYNLLHDLPNPEITSYELRETLIGHVSLRGNGYGYIERNNGGRITEIWPLRPDRMVVERRGGRLMYGYTITPGQPRRYLPADQIWHIRGLSFNGLVGYSVIAYARQAVGLAVAAEEFGARLFQNNTRPAGVITHPLNLSADAQKRLKKNWEATYGGLENSHKTAILEEGMDYKQIGIPPNDAQFLETRKFQIQEIARMFRIPPHMLADLDRATFSNIEHQSLEFIRDTLRPWLVRIEQSISRDMLTPQERRQYYAEFLIDSLLRGDAAGRAAMYTAGRQWGWFSANDIRQMENMNPIPGGDLYLSPLNMIPADQAGDMRADPALATERRAELQQTATDRAAEIRAADHRAAAGRRRLINNYIPVLADVLARIMRREANDIGNQAVKQLENGPGPFWTWIDDFYSEFEPVIRRYLWPVMLSFAGLMGDAAADDIDGEAPDLEAFVGAYIARYAARHIGKSRQNLEDAIAEDDPAEALEEMARQWREERPEIVAQDEGQRAGNGIAKWVWTALGITKLVWVASGSDTCEYCRGLDGKVISITLNFVDENEPYEPEGAPGPLKPGHKVGHPPLHRGCNCGIAARR